MRYRNLLNRSSRGCSRLERGSRFIAGLIAWAIALAAAPLLCDCALAQALDPHGNVGGVAWKGKTDVPPQVLARGEEVYKNVCSACHETGTGRAPTRFILNQMTPDAIHSALVDGLMKMQGSGLTSEQKVAVAEYLTQQRMGLSKPVPPLMCKGATAAFDRTEAPSYPGWGLELANTHVVPITKAGITPDNVKRLKLKWAIGFPNSLRARSEPLLAGGAVFVGSHDGTVYALDSGTGCARWVFKARAEVRTSVVVDDWRAGDTAARPLAYFGDILGYMYAVDAFTGKQVWQQPVEDHPSATVTASPALYKGVLYVPVSSGEEGAAANPNYACCTFRGSITALDAATGQLKWRTYLVPPPQPQAPSASGVARFGPSGAAVWNSPAIDEKRNALYIDTGDNYSKPASPLSDAIVAIDLKDGHIRWAYQASGNDVWNDACLEVNNKSCPEDSGPDYDFGANTVLARGTDGRDYVLAGQKSGIAYSVDAETGKLAWKQQVGRGGIVGGIHFGLAAENGVVFVPISDAPDGKSYNMPAKPGLYALDVAKGNYIWRAPSADDVCKGRPFCHPGYTAALTITPDLVLAGAADGWFRIYDAHTGKVIWQADTTGEVTTVNGTKAHGGSIGGGTGPVPYHGMIFLPSGYGFSGKMPGNVLLAYSTN